jgi:Ca2+-binding RTX toxin-like protein
MEGGDGDDYFFVGGTASGSFNRIIGGNGFDTIRYFEALVHDWATNTFSGNANNAALAPNDVDGWVLSDSADRLNLHNTLANSVIFGNGGNDTLTGGLGQDTLNGGGGADSFPFRLLTGTADIIQDFTSGQDRITVLRAWLGQPAGGEANIPLVNFVSGGAPAPTFATPQLLYNTATGLLSFDSDGTGGAAAISLASLGAGRPLAASDIWMV